MLLDASWRHSDTVHDRSPLVIGHGAICSLRVHGALVWKRGYNQLAIGDGCVTIF